ncbi:restriction endonuclease subunit S [Selenomonas sp.]|uniref:restriction endonuclease subunit S n=1 Tax=Selenomonas sp. TaxID=2053611 RepID=UPI0025D863E5|nr:restriction endonuclease subunit S [Selenomonas sp.]MBQ1867782.1 restriction endonuclease subunit S [Selenomonas sp.]
MATLMSYFAPPIAGEWGDEAEDNTDGVPVLRTTNFTADGRLSYDDLTYRSIDTEKKENKILQPGDIIIEKSGGTPQKPVGRCVYFDRDDEFDYFCSNFTAILRANPEDVNTKYLWYILQEHYKTRQCLKYQYKTNGIANLDIKDYLSHKEIELPSREVQDKRVEAMDYSQYLLDLHQELLDIMDNAVKSRFVEMFGDPVRNPMNWEKGLLKDITSKIGSGATPKGGNASYKNEGISLIRSMNVHNGYFDYKGLAHIDGEQASLLDNVNIESKDVLLNITGASVARCCVVPDDILPARVNQHVCILRCKDDILPMFLNAVLISDQYQAKLWNIAEAGATRQALSKEKIETFQIILPPISLQKQFANFVDLIDKSKLLLGKVVSLGHVPK